jgi:hypothetical protein
MVNQLGFAKRFLLLVTPLATSSALAPLALSIAVSPSLAATLASSEARFNIDNLSHNPLSVLALTEASAEDTIVTSDRDTQITVEANAFAAFLNSQSPPSAYNTSISKVNGDGSNYFGEAKSVAEVIGYNFLVEQGETFSFKFKGSLDLETSIDDPQAEAASATGEISLVLFDSSDEDNLNSLDSFTVYGDLTTLEDGDFIKYDNSANISLEPSGTSFETSSEMKQEYARALVQGKYSRTFDRLTYLTLVESKSNQASATATASAAVPEPSTILASLFFCLAGLGYKMRSKVFGAKLKITQ